MICTALTSLRRNYWVQIPQIFASREGHSRFINSLLLTAHRITRVSYHFDFLISTSILISLSTVIRAYRWMRDSIRVFCCCLAEFRALACGSRTEGDGYSSKCSASWTSCIPSQWQPNSWRFQKGNLPEIDPYRSEMDHLQNRLKIGWVLRVEYRISFCEESRKLSVATFRYSMPLPKALELYVGAPRKPCPSVDESYVQLPSRLLQVQAGFEIEYDVGNEGGWRRSQKLSVSIYSV